MSEQRCTASGCTQARVVRFVSIVERQITVERSFCSEHGDTFLSAYYQRPYPTPERSPANPELAAYELDSLLCNESGHACICLSERSSGLFLGFASGVCEAFAIENALRGPDVFPRPLTHELFGRAIGLLGGILRCVRIDDLLPETRAFIATLELNHKGSIIEVDSRPSDAIALAIVLDAPIFVRRSVVQMGHTLAPASMMLNIEDFRERGLGVDGSGFPCEEGACRG